jgi:hypothetical protein
LNIADTVGFQTVQGTPDEKISDLVSRLELFRNDLINQLRVQPTVFFANPVAEAEKVVGAKAGDIAVWVDDTGTQQYRILGV